MCCEMRITKTLFRITKTQKFSRLRRAIPRSARIVKLRYTFYLLIQTLETLLKKLANLKFSNSSIKIILSYLSNTQQYVQLDDKKSSYRPIYFRVPQSSIFGPILFNIYISSLPSCLKSNSIQYADDTSLHLSNSIRNIQSAISVLKTDIKKLDTWMVQKQWLSL